MSTDANLERMEVDEVAEEEKKTNSPRAFEVSSSPSLDLASSSDSDSDSVLEPLPMPKRRLAPLTVIDLSQEVEPTSAEPAKQNRPVTTSKDLWQRHIDTSQLPCNIGDEAFVVNDAVEALPAEEEAGMAMTEVEALTRPISWNHLDPVRERAKQARKSDLDLLKEQRRAKQAQPQPAEEEEEDAKELPIFGQPRERQPTSSRRAPQATPSTTTTASSVTYVVNAAPRKRRRPELDQDDLDEFLAEEYRDEGFLPSFGPDFVVDDGYGYGDDPLYAHLHVQEPENPRPRPKQQAKTAPKRGPSARDPNDIPEFLASAAAAASSTTESLPSYGANFIVDDGSGYGPDPLYLGGSGQKSKKTSPTRVSSSTNAIFDQSDTHSVGSPTRSASPMHISPQRRSGDALLASPSTSPPTRTTRAIPIPMFAHIDESSRDAERDVELLDAERSNHGSVGSHTTIITQPLSGLTGSHTSSITTTIPSVAPKFRLNVRVKEETMLIVCKPGATFEWLLKETAQKYRQISRMEVEVDHLETIIGSKLIPQDKIEDYMNDSETVVGLIKESRPLNLVVLYRADCESTHIPEYPMILERLVAADNEDVSASDGAHKLNLCDTLLSTDILPSLRGILNLHTFCSIDLSRNSITSSGFAEILTELAKSNGTDRLASFNFSENLLGLSLDLDISRRLLPKFSGLTSIELSANCLNDRAATWLLPTLFSSCPILADLDLSANLFGHDALSNLTVDSCPLYRLTSLRLARNPLYCDGFLQLVRLLDHPDKECQLCSLDLGYTNSFTFRDVVPAANAPKRGVASLDDAFEKLRSRATRLANLDLSGCHFDSTRNPLLFPSLCIAFKRLTCLNVADCGLTASDIKFISLGIMSSLNLSYNSLTSQSRTHVLDLLQTASETLAVAQFDSCGIRQEEVTAIVSTWLARRPNFRLLNLSGNVEDCPQTQLYKTQYPNVLL